MTGHDLAVADWDGDGKARCAVADTVRQSDVPGAAESFALGRRRIARRGQVVRKIAHPVDEPDAQQQQQERATDERSAQAGFDQPGEVHHGEERAGIHQAMQHLPASAKAPNHPLGRGRGEGQKQQERQEAEGDKRPLGQLSG